MRGIKRKRFPIMFVLHLENISLGRSTFLFLDRDRPCSIFVLIDRPRVSR